MEPKTKTCVTLALASWTSFWSGPYRAQKLTRRNRILAETTEGLKLCLPRNTRKKWVLKEMASSRMAQPHEKTASFGEEEKKDRVHLPLFSRHEGCSKEESSLASLHILKTMVGSDWFPPWLPRTIQKAPQEKTQKPRKGCIGK